nr:MAG TPA: hypothetical protein [Caudoviricetes sp.]DAY42248.1 MAG TPA: hypothetical protein [Caudoviricetes sp.]
MSSVEALIHNELILELFRLLILFNFSKDLYSIKL